MLTRRGVLAGGLAQITASTVPRHVLAEVPVDARDFGVQYRPDTDSTAPFQRAIDHACRNAVPLTISGPVLISAPLLCSSDLVLSGITPAAEIILGATASRHTLLETRPGLPSAQTSRQFNIRLQSIGFRGHGEPLTPTSPLIRVSAASSVSIADCRFSEHRFILLSILGCRNVVISGCRFTDWGIQTKTKQGGPAIHLSAFSRTNEETRAVEIRDCLFRDGEWVALSVYARDVRIANNTIDNIREAGIFLFRERPGDSPFSGAENVIISDNSISNVSAKDISAAGMEIGARNATVTNNKIYRTASSGIKVLDPASKVVVASNVITDSVLDPHTFRNHGQIQVQAGCSTSLNPEDIKIYQNVVRSTMTPPSAPFAISVSERPCARPIASLRITENDLRGAYSQQAIRIIEGMLGAGSELSDNRT